MAAGMLSFGICQGTILSSVSYARSHHVELESSVGKFLFKKIFVSPVIPWFGLLSHISPFRLSSRHSSLVFTLRMMQPTPPCPVPNHWWQTRASEPLLCWQLWLGVYSVGLPGGSAGKESACNMGDLDLIPGLGRSPGEGNRYPLQLPTSVFWPGESMDLSPWGRKESDTTECILCVCVCVCVCSPWLYCPEIPKLCADMPMRGFPVVWKLLLLHNSLPRTGLHPQIFCLCLPLVFCPTSF